jgi:hypothetical protein
MAQGRKPGSTGRVERVDFNGVAFRRYPDSKWWADRTYFTPLPRDRRRGVGRLHQEIWKAAHGPIPGGHDIHHRDHNASNNALDNLVCIPNDDHRAEHADQPRTDAQHAQFERAQAAAAEWHGSEEGRAWHIEHGARTWDNREDRHLVCEWCKETFGTRDRNPSTRFCSGRCRAYARKASGVDDIDRVCTWCSATFRINRYAKARTCSRVCGQAVRRRKG